mmetsp:Transcript_45553/g.143076  ORF Transcript_45553/g.143076 Transcript_45553/m.143076 type:complete len:206 (+) Transcript_45553:867-1484(+)
MPPGLRVLGPRRPSRLSPHDLLVLQSLLRRPQRFRCLCPGPPVPDVSHRLGADPVSSSYEAALHRFVPQPRDLLRVDLESQLSIEDAFLPLQPLLRALPVLLLIRTEDIGPSGCLGRGLSLVVWDRRVLLLTAISSTHHSTKTIFTNKVQLKDTATEVRPYPSPHTKISLLFVFGFLWGVLSPTNATKNDFFLFIPVDVVKRASL